MEFENWEILVGRRAGVIEEEEENPEAGTRIDNKHNSQMAPNQNRNRATLEGGDEYLQA